MSDRTYPPILAAVRAELGVLEVRIAKLRELERLALELDGEPPPRPSAGLKVEGGGSPKKTTRRPAVRRKPGETPMAILNALREGPATSAKLQTLVGVSQAPVDKALRDLFGTGKVQHDDGTPRTWSLMPFLVETRNGNEHANGNGNNGPAPEREEPDDPEIADAAYLERRLVGLLERGPQSLAEAAAAIDAPAAAVASACERLTQAGQISLMTDGRWVA